MITQIADTNEPEKGLRSQMTVQRKHVRADWDAEIGQDRITRIFDATVPEVRYTYDSDGNLATFKDQAGEIWTFGYDGKHNLLSVLDPRGIEVLTTAYDEQGRPISTADAFGKLTIVAHDTVNVTEIVTDRSGNVTQYIYDTNGFVTQEIGPDGAVKDFTYDEFGSKTSETRYDAFGTPLTGSDRRKARDSDRGRRERCRARCY